jgi:tRNA A-37 threonylcarbamoyl transferase component Bud32
MTTALQAGAVFANDYRIVRPLNQGGMGAVYVVEQISTGKPRALKLMHVQLVSDPELRRRFEQEARVGSRIASEHVVEVNAAGVDAENGLPYLVMELLEGEDLAARIKRTGPIALEEMRVVFEQLCHAMTAAHGAGIVHRDLKPENIFLARSLRAGGAPFTVKVLDFGIAKLAAEAGTHGTTGAMGSPLWMAPEQTERGAVTPAADVWAMGLIAFYLLTGFHFWRTANTTDGTVAQLLREIVLEPIPIASQRAAERGVAARLPAGFDAWFAKAVVREVPARFGHAAEAWYALATIVGADPLGATAIGVPSSAPMTAPVPSPMVINAPPPSVVAASVPAASIGGVTPAPMTTTTQAPAGGGNGKWMIATAVLAGLLVAGAGLAIGGYFLTRSKPQPAAATAPLPSATSATVSVATPAAASAPLPSASAGVDTAPPPTATGLATAKATQKPVATKPIATAPDDDDPNGPNGSMNNHTWKLKSGAHVRLIGGIVKNDSNVADPIVRKAVEWSAWQYNRCYDGSFGQQSANLPQGTVVIGFDILDQLPRYGKVERSEFTDSKFDDCVKGTLIGQTINAAGPNGKGHVSYSFKFVPNP